MDQALILAQKDQLEEGRGSDAKTRRRIERSSAFRLAVTADGDAANFALSSFGLFSSKSRLDDAFVTTVAETISKKFINNFEKKMQLREYQSHKYVVIKDNSNLPQIGNPMMGAC